jgi:predicted dehydrogenase
LGTLTTDVDGKLESRKVEPVLGSYRQYYAAVRDAILGVASPPVEAIDAWRVARILAWAMQSSAERREIPCEWS